MTSLHDKVLTFMDQANRPMAINEIHEGIGKDNQKQAVQKAIELLVASKKLIEKIYVKQKIFVINQSNSKISNEEVRKQFNG